MKTTPFFLAIFAVAALTFSPLALHAQDDQGAPPPPPDQSQGGGDNSASFDEFYNNLSSQGSWIQTPDYGYVFQPTVQDPNWAPYTDGHWVYTDYGWTWVSDEPWGWATYHYGRWVNIVGEGWVWVPGYQWAPAWVSWRYGGGYAGWAPLPPATFVGVEYGGPGVNLGLDFHFGSDVDVAFGIGAGCYNFIPIGYIGEPRYHGYYLDRSRNFTVINNTTNITNIYVTRNSGNAFSAVRGGGPSLAQVNAQARTPVQQVRLSASGRAGVSAVSGGTLSVFRPQINPATLHTSRPATVARTLSSVQVNRGTSVTQPLQVNSHFKPAAPSESVVAAARAAQAHAPQYVATSTRVAPTVSASTVQRAQTQYVQKAQAAALAKPHTTTANSNVSNTYHPSTETATHAAASVTPRVSSSEAEPAPEVKREQESHSTPTERQVPAQEHTQATHEPPAQPQVHETTHEATHETASHPQPQARPAEQHASSSSAEHGENKKDNGQNQNH